MHAVHAGDERGAQFHQPPSAHDSGVRLGSLIPQALMTMQILARGPKFLICARRVGKMQNQVHKRGVARHGNWAMSQWPNVFKDAHHVYNSTKYAGGILKYKGVCGVILGD